MSAISDITNLATLGIVVGLGYVGYKVVSDPEGILAGLIPSREEAREDLLNLELGLWDWTKEAARETIWYPDQPSIGEINWFPDSWPLIGRF